MTDEEIIEELKRLTRASEVMHINTFEVLRGGNRGVESQEVIVKIYDAGNQVDPQLRYSCTATSNDGREATGNPGESIRTTLSTVHWQDLDRD